jgi:hypothetical protein
MGVLVLVLVAGSAVLAPAMGGLRWHPQSLGPEPASPQGPRTTVLVAHRLRSTAISESYLKAEIGPGRTPLESAAITLTCPGKTTCTFEADQNVEVMGTSSNNKWAVCTDVDGDHMTEPLCPYLGNVPKGFFGAGSFVQSMSGITPGTHKIRTFVITKNGATRGVYMITYRVYTP